MCVYHWGKRNHGGSLLGCLQEGVCCGEQPRQSQKEWISVEIF